jgi:UDPglucose--hexose-1-phosphate uridylyltransferase
MPEESITDASPQRDPLTGDLTVVVSGRQSRPNLPDRGCPFCPGGTEAPDDFDVRWFPNRWPPLPDGRAEVVLYTADHDATFWSLGRTGARRVVDLWADRSAALGARDDVAYVLVFENRGPSVGATIAHPHGQIYAFESVPPRAVIELDGGPAADGALGAMAAGPDDVRLVTSQAGWRAWVPATASWPYEMVVAPELHVPDLPSLDGAARDGLAQVLIDVLERLDRLFDTDMPYMLWFHQQPFDGSRRGPDRPRLHAHVVPQWRAPGVPRFVAAAELGAAVYFNPVAPPEAAAALRAAGTTHAP